MGQRNAVIGESELARLQAENAQLREQRDGMSGLAAKALKENESLLSLMQRLADSNEALLGVIQHARTLTKQYGAHQWNDEYRKLAETLHSSRDVQIDAARILAEARAATGGGSETVSSLVYAPRQFNRMYSKPI